MARTETINEIRAGFSVEKKNCSAGEWREVSFDGEHAFNVFKNEDEPGPGDLCSGEYFTKNATGEFLDMDYLGFGGSENLDAAAAHAILLAAAQLEEKRADDPVGLCSGCSRWSGLLVRDGFYSREVEDADCERCAGDENARREMISMIYSEPRYGYAGAAA